MTVVYRLPAEHYEYDRKTDLLNAEERWPEDTPVVVTSWTVKGGRERHTTIAGLRKPIYPSRAKGIAR